MAASTQETSQIPAKETSRENKVLDTANTVEPDDQYDDGTVSILSGGSASLASSILDYKYENGRRYQAFRDREYFLPSDEAESDRLDLLHHIFGLMLGGSPWRAPILEGGHKPKRILDFGTGTGERMCLQIVVLSNGKFYVDDIEQPWDWSKAEAFDYIHGRTLAGCIKDWPKLIREAFKHTKPGGWYEAQEYSMRVASDDGTHNKLVYIPQWSAQVEQACEAQGLDMAIASKLKGWMIDAGFVDVQEEVKKVPLNPWPKEKKLKQIGMYYQAQAYDAAEVFVLQLFKLLGKTDAETRDFIENVRKEIKDRSVHAYTSYWFVWGRKPE